MIEKFKSTLLFLLLFSIAAHSNSKTSGDNAFIKNQGQILNQHYQQNNEVLYIYKGNGINIQLRKSGYSYELLTAAPVRRPEKNKTWNITELQQNILAMTRVDIDFKGMNKDIEIVEADKTSHTFNYFTYGQEISGINSYRKIIYKNIYPFTDIEFFITENPNAPLKYNIILRPGADPSRINFECSGAKSIQQKNANELCIGTSAGSITEQIPLSYYTDSPRKKENIQFILKGNSFGFKGEINTSKTLVIDPSSNIIWATYFGGSSLDNSTSVGTDAAGNVFLSGFTLSSSNIATTGAYQNTLAGVYDLYLAKFTSSGALTWCTYYGGTGVEISYAMYVEPAGDVYICGDASSTVNIASPGAHQIVYGGGIDDALLVKFNTNGQRLWATYYGGSEHDIAYVITVDANGNPIVAGHTESPNTGNCIGTTGAYSTAFSLASDVYVAKFNSSGVRQWGTYYGDTDFEEAWGIDTDASGNIIITGFSNSLSGIATPSSHQPFNAGSQDAFLAKFNPTGTSLLWGTFFGGLGDEQGTAVEIDNSGNIYVTGNTTSSSGIVTAGAQQSSMGSADDAFLTAFSSAGTQLWGTYFGGEEADYINDLTIDINNNLLFCGQSLSTGSISTSGAYQFSLATINSYDAYFAKFKNNGVKILATYYGGEANDNAKSIAIDNSGTIYLSGETTSTMNISTPGTLNTSYLGNFDAFLARFCVSPAATISPAGSATICMNSDYTLTASPGAGYFWNTAATSSTIVLAQPHTPGTYYFTVVVTDAFGCNASSDSTQIVIDNCVTGNDEHFPNVEAAIYPTPASDMITISFSENESYRFQLFTTAGVKAMEGLGKGRTVLPLGELPAGIYLAEIESSQGKITKKIIKAP